MKLDADYVERLQSAMSRAIFEASLDRNSNTAVLMTGEIITACLDVIASMIFTSPAVATPAKEREFAGEVAKLLRKRIAAFKASQAADPKWTGRVQFATLRDYGMNS